MTLTLTSDVLPTGELRCLLSTVVSCYLSNAFSLYKYAMLQKYFKFSLFFPVICQTYSRYINMHIVILIQHINSLMKHSCCKIFWIFPYRITKSSTKQNGMCSITQLSTLFCTRTVITAVDEIELRIFLETNMNKIGFKVLRLYEYIS